MQTQISKDLFDLVCKNPLEWQLKLVFADALEDERLLDWAECQRWIGKEKKRPLHLGENELAWYDQTKYEDNKYDQPSNIPKYLYDLLGEFHRNTNVLYKIYIGQEAAQIAIMNAWIKAKEAGWNP